MKKIIKIVIALFIFLNINFSWANINKIQNQEKIQISEKIKLDNALQNFYKKLNKKFKDKNKRILVLEKINFLIEKIKKWKKNKILNILNYLQINISEKIKQEKNSINTFQISNEIWKVSDLKLEKKEFKIWNKIYFILRSFTQNNKKKYLIVEDKTYKTYVILAKNVLDTKDFSELYNNSSYKKNLDLVYKNREVWVRKWWKYLQNAWLKTWKNSWNNIYLTADFCPSSKKWFENKVIEKFMKKWNKNIAIAISSTWINKHQKDFQTLINWNNSWKLNIIWVNHTKTHKYNFSSDFSTTFILTPWLNLEDEILDVEKKLLEKAQIPSIFLRYPWLISNEKIFKKTIYKYWLIPLWSNTWLAKWKRIKDNSIILIHWNKNEPAWIKIFNKILDKKNNFYYDNLNNSLIK